MVTNKVTRIFGEHITAVTESFDRVSWCGEPPSSVPWKAIVPTDSWLSRLRTKLNATGNQQASQGRPQKGCHVERTNGALNWSATRTQVSVTFLSRKENYRVRTNDVEMPVSATTHKGIHPTWLLPCREGFQRTWSSHFWFKPQDIQPPIFNPPRQSYRNLQPEVLNMTSRPSTKTGSR
jgi:hypothetical protein